LSSGRNRVSLHEFGELLPRLTGRQLQVVGKISHMARLLVACSALEAFALLTTTELAAG